jgi:DNA polymerase-1
MPIVAKTELPDALAILMEEKYLALDTETTGLKWYGSDKLFSIQIAAKEQVFYFNFNELEPDTLLPRSALHALAPLFKRSDCTWFMHNAKFDLGMLSREGVAVSGIIHCTEAMARIINSKYKSYRLSECLKRMNLDLRRKGLEKIDKVYKHVLSEKLYTDIKVRGKDKPIREMHYEQVPMDLMVEYAEMDALATYNLGQYQRSKFFDLSIKNKDLALLVKTERQLTKVLFEMQKAGIQLDLLFNDECLEGELSRCEELRGEWSGYTEEPFVDSAATLRKVFHSLGYQSPISTPSGAESFAKTALESFDHPLAAVVLEHRAAAKRAGTYHSSFSYYGATGRIHADSRQGGTATGRLSYREPNLQNLPKVDEEDKALKAEAARVRQCFVPRDGYAFFMPDYDQMEYRFMLELADETALINKINNEGLDVHTATAEMVGISRKQAKTVNFMLLYGGGAEKLADALDISLQKAKEIKLKYFQALPRINRWIKKTKFEAKRQGFTLNIAGRKCHISEKFAYKAPNYLVQGACADVMKRAMVKVHEYIQDQEAQMLIQIHDELLIEVHRSALHVCPRIVEIMEDAYPYKKLKLTAGPKHSWKSWGDPMEGYPREETRNQIQRESSKGPKQPPEHLAL